jgi:hypothetical protein
MSMRDHDAGALPSRSEPHLVASSDIVFVRSEVEAELARFRQRRKRDKRKAFGLQMGVVTLAAVSTVLLGLHGADAAVARQLANVALVCTAAVTVITAAEAFFSHRDLWILRTATVRDLEALQRKIKYHEVGAQGAATDHIRADALFSELSAIIENDRKLWERIRNSGPTPRSVERTVIATPVRPASDHEAGE